MNILFTRFPLESAFGGAEKQTMELMRGFREHGHHVSFLGSCSELLDRCHKAGIVHKNLRIGNPPVTRKDAFTFLWRQLSMENKLRAAIDDPKPDVIFMMSLTEKILLTEPALEAGIKVFWIEHDTVGRWLEMNPWLQKLQKLTDQVKTIVVSDLSRAIYLELGWNPENTISIPNGVEFPPGTYRHIKREPGAPLRIGCAARLSEEKGIDVLLEAVEGMENVQLEILGKGRDEETIRKLAKRITNNEKRVNVVLTPFEEDINDFYGRIDVLVLPSTDHDPFGIVAAEAMMRGIPTVVTDVCGIAGHIEAGREAAVVPAGDAELLQGVLETLLRPEAREHLSKNGRAKAENDLKIQRMVERYEELLQQ